MDRPVPSPAWISPFAFNGRELVVAVGELRGSALNGHCRAIGSLADLEDDIRRALEKLISGF